MPLNTDTHSKPSVQRNSIDNDTDSKNSISSSRSNEINCCQPQPYTKTETSKPHCRHHKSSTAMKSSSSASKLSSRSHSQPSFTSNSPSKPLYHLHSDYSHNPSSTQPLNSTSFSDSDFIADSVSLTSPLPDDFSDPGSTKNAFSIHESNTEQQRQQQGTKKGDYQRNTFNKLTKPNLQTSSRSNSLKYLNSFNTSSTNIPSKPPEPAVKEFDSQSFDNQDFDTREFDDQDLNNKESQDITNYRLEHHDPIYKKNKEFGIKMASLLEPNSSLSTKSNNGSTKSVASTKSHSSNELVDPDDPLYIATTSARHSSASSSISSVHPPPTPLLLPSPNPPSSSSSQHPSPPSHLTALPKPHQLDIRATQRTFEGAYIRTALGQLTFALVVLKLFSAEFVAIGTVFTVQGVVILGVAGYRRRYTVDGIIGPYLKPYMEPCVNACKELVRKASMSMSRRGSISSEYRSLNQQNNNTTTNNTDFNPKQNSPLPTHFDTSGPTVVFVSLWTIATYIAIIVLLNRLD